MYEDSDHDLNADEHKRKGELQTEQSCVDVKEEDLYSTLLCWFIQEEAVLMLISVISCDRLQSHAGVLFLSVNR